MESLQYPRLEEIYTESEYGEPGDLPTQRLLDILNGKESSYFDLRDVKEVLLHRKVAGDALLIDKPIIPLHFYGFLLILLFFFAFFGWKLYKSLKEREKRREEKKKLKQKKKK